MQEIGNISFSPCSNLLLVSSRHINQQQIASTYLVQVNLGKLLHTFRHNFKKSGCIYTWWINYSYNICVQNTPTEVELYQLGDDSCPKPVRKIKIVPTQEIIA